MARVPAKVVGMEEAFLRAIQESPADETPWLVLADWLEEQGDQRAELLRLSQTLRRAVDQPNRPELEDRLRELLAAGVRPCVPVLTNSTGMRLALIPPGVFLMGSPHDEKGRHTDEGPRHEVRIKRPFYLGVYPVTQEEHERVTRSNPSHFSAAGPGERAVEGLDTSRFPVENMSRDRALRFCRRLSGLSEEGRAGRSYRLPTEAEWEYACRAGTSTAYHFGAELTLAQANTGHHPHRASAKKTYLGRPCPVGSYPGNAFGLFDMHGNVYEWCEDRYAKSYPTSRRRDPRGPAKGEDRVLRGGCWFDNHNRARSAARHRLSPGIHASGLGLRVALPVPASG